MNTDVKDSPSHLVIDGYDYYLDKAPDADAPLVLKHRDSVLKNIDLQTVYSNLERTADLVKLAYVSVAGIGRGSLQARISGLQKDLLDLSKNCILTMDRLQRSSDEVLDYIGKTYKWLLKGNEKMAISQLSKCSNQAVNMANQCQILVDETDKLAKEAEKIKQEVIKEQGIQDEKRRELEDIVAEAEANKKVALALQEEMIGAVKNINKMYKDAKEREAAAGEREMIAGIVSGITQAVSAGLGAYNNGMNNNQNNDKDDGPSAADKKELETAKSDKSKAESDVKAIQTEIDALEKQVDTLNDSAAPLEEEKKKAEEEVEATEKAVEEAKGDKDKLKEAQAKLEAAKKDVTRAELEIEDQQTKLEKAKKDIKKKKEDLTEKSAKLKGLEATLESLSKSFEEMSKSASSEREAISKEKMRLLEQKFELESQKRKAITDVVKYTEKIKSSQFQQNYAETAVYSLGLAIKAMAQIVTALTEMNLFWNSMADYCKYLAEAKFKEEIESLMESMNKEDRIEYYSDPDFKIIGIEDMAKWKALSVICEEYHKASQKTFDKVTGNINAAPTLSEAPTLVIEYANDVLTEAGTDLEKQQKRIDDLKKQQDEYRQAS